MTSDSSLIERQMADVELRPFTLDEFHRRRHRKQRNRRIATAAMGLALAAVVAGGILETLASDDQTVDSDILGPLPSPFEGSWVSSGGGGDISPESLEIRHVPDGDAYETEVHQSGGASRCSGAASTVTGTGRLRTDPSGLVYLVTSAALTCDDGTAPVPTPGEEGQLDDFQITYVHDPATDEVVDSLGTLWWREGSERKRGDPMATVDRMIGAVNTGDTDAFLDLFAPDGSFDPRGTFQDRGAFAGSQPTSMNPPAGVQRRRRASPGRSRMPRRPG